MNDIKLAKRDHIYKKVTPHLQKSLNYWQAEELEKSENELILAVSAYKKGKMLIPDIIRNLAALYNDLGVKHLLGKNSKKAFTLFSKALDIKIEYFQKDIKSVKGTFRQLIISGLLSCQFNEVRNWINKMHAKFHNNDNFNTDLTEFSDLIKCVENNEPQVFLAGMEMAFPYFTRKIDDLIYFPKAFEEIEINFESEMLLIDHATLECSFLMAQNNSKTKIPIPYENDSWKKMQPKEHEAEINNYTPNLIIFLSETEHIPANSLKVTDSAGNMVDFQFKVAFSEFYIPDSYPRFGFSWGEPLEIPICKNFKYFRGKAGIIEWAMKTGEAYNINLNVKNYQSISSTNVLHLMRVGILTPFKIISYKKMTFKHSNKLLIDSVRQKNIEYFNDRDRPSSYSLLPEPNSISEKQFKNAFSACMEERNFFNLLSESAHEFNDYSIIGIEFCFRVSNEKLSIATFEWEQPVPTALAHLLMDKNFNFPPLCEYDVINNSSKELTLTIKTKIGGFTDEIEEAKILLPYSALKVNQTPLFNRTSLKLRETSEANLELQVLLESQTILKKCIRMSILAFDTMIFEILNPLTREVFNLHDFIAVWVTPHNEEVENVLSIAKEYHPTRTLQGYPSGLSEEKTSQNVFMQCEAIFMALKEIGISYIDSSISFGWLKPYASQRIKLPVNTIKTKAANCIDGTILFASLLEHIGIEPVVILVPRHAFVGWKPFPNSTKIVLLETTLISSANFNEANEAGHTSIIAGLEDAKKMLQKPNLSLEQAVQSGIIKFIDISEMRKKNILPNSM